MLGERMFYGLLIVKRMPAAYLIRINANKNPHNDEDRHPDET